MGKRKISVKVQKQRRCKMHLKSLQLGGAENIDFLVKLSLTNYLLTHNSWRKLEHT